jgi:hypothetical protein
MPKIPGLKGYSAGGRGGPVIACCVVHAGRRGANSFEEEPARVSNTEVVPAQGQRASNLSHWMEWNRSDPSTMGLILFYYQVCDNG